MQVLFIENIEKAKMCFNRDLVIGNVLEFSMSAIQTTIVI